MEVISKGRDIRGLSSVPNPYFRLRLTANVANLLPLQLASRLPKSTQVSDFEDAFSKLLGLRFARATNSGRGAILLALRTLGIGSGDEVIIPSLVCGAVADAILSVGAQPVLADSNREDGNLDLTKLKLCTSPRTKAIIAVHYQGLPCDIDEISEFARSRCIFLIEDCAHAIGSLHSSRQAGTIGDFAIFSFGPDKAMTTGLGGMLTTTSSEFGEAAIAKMPYRSESRKPTAGLRKTLVEVRLTQSRMSYGLASQSYLFADRLVAYLNRHDFQLHFSPMSLPSARLGIAQVSLMEQVVKARRKNANRVKTIIEGHTSLRVAEHAASKEPSLLRLAAVARCQSARDRLSLEFKRNGIEAGPIDWRTPLHRSQTYSRISRLPIRYEGTDWFCDRFINLPVHPYLSEGDFDRIEKVVEAKG